MNNTLFFVLFCFTDCIIFTFDYVYTGIPRRYCSSVADYCNKANIAGKRVTRVFWFPSAYSYVYTIYTVVY